MSALGIVIYGMFIAIIFPPVKNNHKLAVTLPRGERPKKF